MVGASKILTVSYGTFSCTLEGFDDSFSTMKAIAEYFRDLAADDRYFGAEPPTPDAEMLARIAEREIERRVEAHFDGGNVVLRAAETAPAAAALAKVAEPEQEEVADVEAPEAVEEPATEVAETPAADEIEEVVATEEIATPVEETAAEEETPATEAEPADDDAIAAFMDTSDTEIEEPVHVAEATPTPVVHPDEDSIAAKLQRIRAVVAPGDDNDDSIFVEDQHADDEEDVSSDIAAFEAADEEIVEEEIAEVEPVTVETSEEYDEDFEETAEDLDVDDLVSSLEDDAAEDEIEEVVAEEETAEEVVAEEDTEEEVVAEADEADDEAPVGRVFKVKSAVLEEALAEESEDEAEDTDEIPEELAAALSADDDKDEEPVDLVAEAEEDTEEEAEESLFEEEAEEGELSDEEEAELLAELAKVSEEIGTENTRERHGAAVLATLDDPEPSLDRIMEKTNDALEAPESGRKREAFSHLKAAVAATEADRKIRGENENGSDETESYRDDLAQVVRPKRATPPAKAETVRPTRPTAPLKLVAEQRVDTPAPEEAKEPAAAAAPVRPRRISSEPTQAEESEGGFAEFAETVGAQELPDLLEAAAAYTAFVEGRDNFTRPQVMRRAAAVAGKDNFSREDCLRSFGQLLREGKINKLSRGQFVVSEETRFRPDARIAGE